MNLSQTEMFPVFQLSPEDVVLKETDRARPVKVGGGLSNYQGDMFLSASGADGHKTVRQLGPVAASSMINNLIAVFRQEVAEDYEAGYLDPRAQRLTEQFSQKMMHLGMDDSPMGAYQATKESWESWRNTGVHDAYRKGDTERNRRKASKRDERKEAEAEDVNLKQADSSRVPTLAELGFADNGWKRQSSEALAEWEQKSRREVAEIVRTLPKVKEGDKTITIRNGKWPEWYEVTFYSGYQEVSRFVETNGGNKKLVDSSVREIRSRGDESESKFHARVERMFAVKLEALVEQSKKEFLNGH